jgi:hypothetical protein
MKATEFKTTDAVLTARMWVLPILYLNERGIESFVFPNGDLISTHVQRFSRISIQSAGRTAPKQTATMSVQIHGVLIEHDSFAEFVERNTSTTITNDRVSWIGTVYMKYNRFALTKVAWNSSTYRYGEIRRHRRKCKRKKIPRLCLQQHK